MDSVTMSDKPVHVRSANHPSQPRRLLALQRQRQAFQMKLAGATEYEIGKALGVSQQQASKYLASARVELTEAARVDAEQYREIVRRHIFKALAALEPSLMSSDKGEMFAATDRIVRQCERLARLEGLDAPAKADITSGGKPLKGYTVMAHPDQWDAEKENE